MKDKKKRNKIHIATPDEVAEFAQPETSEETTDGAGEQQAPVESAQSDGSEAGANSRPETELERAVRERDEFKDKWLRGKADAQNQARRLRADRDEAVRFAVAGLARSLLNVVDDLDRTIQAAEESTEADSLTKGVRIVYDALLKVLGDHHVERIEALGQPFDPQFHEAITQQPSADLPAGMVLQEIQAGYRLHERVLRPARVIVSCEPPTDDESAGDESDDSEE
jgi:molecular chaperone GrpE